MAEIPLRSYLHEIEKHVESGRTDQAIAHCRHILQFYPKYVDAYRLLGKAYLESQRYGDAADIFQRVLSSVPDDFVSHVGMSIIREDEGNLDAAIWHMERGFEVQPSNNAIQEELRRLYGKRDHVEPQKIRLTRGALARMYYKGELYQQAISEIRATLVDNPDRLDLQALLADIYLKVNQPSAATESAGDVLRRLPNCLITLRVMTQILTSAEREADQKTYRMRLVQLDPYSAYAEIAALSSDSVSEDVLKLEKLDWKPESAMAGDMGQPAWAASLGVDLGDLSPTKEEALPDWLGSVSRESNPTPPQAAPTSAFILDETEPSVPVEQASSSDDSMGDIPDWLREAGWAPSTSAGQLAEAEQAASQPLEEPVQNASPIENPALGLAAASLMTDDNQLAAADLPDWLKAMAPPPDSDQLMPMPGENEQEDVTPWIEKLIPASAKAAPAEAADQTPAPSAELPDWLQGIQPLADETTPQPVQLPDWLSDKGTTADSPESPDVHEAQPAAPETELPEWLLRGEAILAEELFTEPTWDEAAQTVGAPVAQFSDWPSDSEPPSAEAESEASTMETAPASVEPAGELPDWLLEVTPAEAEALPVEPESTRPVEPAIGLPDWLSEVASDGAASPASEPEPAGVEPAAGLPDWLLEVTPAETEPTPTEPKPAFASLDTGLPDWLLEVAPAEGEPEPAAVEPAGELPVWLDTAASLDEAVFSDLTGSEARQAEIAPIEAPSETELPAWLFEGQEPGAAEPLPPEDAAPIDSGLLNWLAKPEPIEGEPVPVTTSPEVEPFSELPDWLFEAQQPASAETGVELGQIFDAGGLDWIQEPAPAEEPAPPAAEPAEIPAWLLEAAGTAPSASELAVSPGESQLSDTQPVRVKPESLTESTSAPESTGANELEDAFAWLMGLAAGGAVAPSIPAIPAEPEPEAGAALTETSLTGEPAALEVSDEAASEDALAGQLPLEPLATEPASSEAILDVDSAFAWLESLAVKQGASEALILKPEERQEAMPEWVQQDMLAAEQAALQPPSAEPALIQPEDGEAIPIASDQIELPKIEQEVVEPAAGETAFDQDSAFAWLESLAVKQGVDEALILPPEQRQEAMPEWVRQESLTAEPAPSEKLPETQTAPEAGLEELTWMAEGEAEPALEVEPEIETPLPVETTSVFDLQDSIEPPTPVIEPELPTELPVEQAPILAEAVTSVPESESPEPFQTAADEALPDLPDWLTDSVISPREELDWTPPPVPHRRYDLNQVSLSELERLPGIGFIAAQQITTYRDAHGPFLQLDDMARVSGIGPALLDSLRDYLFVVEPQPPAQALLEAVAQPEASGGSEVAPELAEARARLTGGEMPLALEQYAGLIHSSLHLDYVIQDLQAAAYRFPTDINVWQHLGDACLRADRVQEALQAFIKAEQLLN